MKRIILASCACALLSAAPALAQSGLGEFLGQMQGGAQTGGLLGQIQNTAKASAFDAVVGSQAPALSGFTDNLTAEQKARLFDLGADNMGTLGALGSASGGSAGTLGTLATGAAALGLVPQMGASTQTDNSTIRQPVQPAYNRPQPTYPPASTTYRQPAYQAQPQQPVYGTAQPTYQQPVYQAQPQQPVYGTVQPTYQQPAYQAQPQQPVYGAAQPTYQQPAYQAQPQQPVYGAVQPTYQQPAYQAQPQQPVYGTTQPTYQQPAPTYQTQQPAYTAPVPATGTQTTSQQDVIGNLIQLGIGALGN